MEYQFEAPVPEKVVKIEEVHRRMYPPVYPWRDHPHDPWKPGGPIWNEPSFKMHDGGPDADGIGHTYKCSTKGVQSKGPTGSSVSNDVSKSCLRGKCVTQEYSSESIQSLSMDEARTLRPKMYETPVQTSETKDGITVKGSASSQTFRYGALGALEANKYCIILKLRGTDSKGERVVEAVRVDQKLQCETCGTKNKSSHKFCTDCGSALV